MRREARPRLRVAGRGPSGRPPLATGPIKSAGSRADAPPWDAPAHTCAGALPSGRGPTGKAQPGTLLELKETEGIRHAEAISAYERELQERDYRLQQMALGNEVGGRPPARPPPGDG